MPHRTTRPPAQTGGLDARLLAGMGERLDLEPGGPFSPARRALQALATRRRQLVEHRKQERTRMHQTADALARLSIQRSIRPLDVRTLLCEKQIAEAVAVDEETAALVRRLQTASGVGPVVAATLVAEMPELGSLDRRSVASLAGLAPVARDPGQRSSQRRIAGGRPIIRSMLCLAALQASRRCETFKRSRQRIQDNGKTTKRAIVTTARKLLAILNAMIRTQTDFQNQDV